MGKRLWTGSVSGSVKLPPNGDGLFSEKTLYDAILSEIKAETGIRKNELKNHKIVILAAYRDLVEGGKPHLVFLVQSSLSKEEIKKRIDTSMVLTDEKSVHEESYYRKKELQTQIDAKQFQFFNRLEVENMELSCDKLKVRYKGRMRSFKTAPSYVASVWILREYWKQKDAIEA